MRLRIIVGLLAFTALIVPDHAFAAIRAARPVTLKIPKIKVTATIEAKGLTSRGFMRPPSGPWTVAWDSGGVVPGNPGEAVIYGHYTDTHFKPAVFYNLNKLIVGDKLSVTDAKRYVRTFKVTKKRLIRADRINYFDLVQDSRYIHLNLYTCAGTWNSRLRHYSHYLVVYTSLVSVRHL